MNKRFNIEKVLPLDQVNSIIPSGEIEIGHPEPDFNIIDKITKKWIPEIQKSIVKAYQMNNRWAFNDLFHKRGLLFSEFIQLYNAEIKEEDYTRKTAFLYLNIHTKAELYTKFIFQYEKQSKEEAYTDCMRNSGFSEILGFFLPKLPGRISYKDLLPHAYVSGSSGSGKSAFLRLLIYQLHKNYPNNSLLIIDPHSDLAKQAYYSDASLDKERVVYISPDLRENYTAIFNPFDVGIKNEMQADLLAQEMDGIIESMLDEETSKVLKSILHPILCVLLLRKGSTFPDIVRFLDPDNNKDLIEAGLESPFLHHRPLFQRISSGYYNRTRDSLTAKLQSIINYDSFYKMSIGESTFDLKQCLNNKKVVIFSFPFGQTGGQARELLGKLILNQVMHIGFERAKLAEEDRPQTFIIVDEAQNFITSSLAKGYDELRKYGMHFITASQYVNQLESIQESILANSNMKIIGWNNTKDTYHKLMNTSGINENVLYTLEPLTFYIKAGAKQGFKYKLSKKLFGDKHMMSKKEMDEMDEYQLKEYYVPFDRTKLHKRKFEIRQDISSMPIDDDKPLDLFLPDDLPTKS